VFRKQSRINDGLCVSDLFEHLHNFCLPAANPGSVDSSPSAQGSGDEVTASCRHTLLRQ
jgi:hypothetical protein